MSADQTDIAGFQRGEATAPDKGLKLDDPVIGIDGRAGIDSVDVVVDPKF